MQTPLRCVVRTRFARRRSRTQQLRRARYPERLSVSRETRSRSTPAAPAKLPTPIGTAFMAQRLADHRFVLTISRQFLQRSHNRRICAQAQNRETVNLKARTSVAAETSSAKL